MKTREVFIVIAMLSLVAVSIFIIKSLGAEDEEWISIIDPKDPTAIITKKGDPNDPNRISFGSEHFPIKHRIYGVSAKYVEFMLGDDNEIVCDGTREKWLKLLYESISSKEPTGKVTLIFKEGPSRYFCAKCNKEIQELARTDEYTTPTITLLPMTGNLVMDPVDILIEVEEPTESNYRKVKK